jgi:hypothetical protein
MARLPETPRCANAGELTRAAVCMDDTSPVEHLCLDDRREAIGAVSLLFRYGENSGDSTHAGPHGRTPCHYQVFF